MSNAASEQALSLTANRAYEALREALQRAGFTAEGVAKVLGTENTSALTGMEFAVERRRPRGYDPLQTLIRLFLMHDPVPVPLATAALAPLSLEQGQEMGLLELAGDQVSARVKIQPFAGLYLFCDHARKQGELQADHVTGVNVTSAALAFLTIRQPVETALDLGTGCGVQALLASSHARQVLATDIIPRALNLTAASARLNGLTNVECRQGSFLEPVQGQTFDLIVANPPYVISPESRYVFRDGGQRGDSLCAQIARQLPSFLRPGGFGHLVCNWAVPARGDWQEPVRRWFTDSGCDVLALLYLVEDALTYAAKWLKPEYLGRPDEYGQAIDRWMDSYRAWGIEAVATGGLIIRKRDGGTPWFYGYEAPGTNVAPCGTQLAGLFRIQDWWQTQPDMRALLDCRLRLAEGAYLEEVAQNTRGNFVPKQIRLRLNEGLPFRVPVDGLIRQLAKTCDGRQTLRDLLQKQAEPHEVTIAQLEPAYLPVIRDLVLRGFLTVGE